MGAFSLIITLFFLEKIILEKLNRFVFILNHFFPIVFIILG